MWIGYQSGYYLLQKSVKDEVPRQRPYLWDGGTPLPLWLSEKTRRFSGQMYRSDGKVLIKLLRRLTSLFSVNGIQDHLKDCGMRRYHKERIWIGSILWRMGEIALKNDLSS